MKRLILILVLSLLAASAGAQTTRYVTDELQVDLRAGPTNGYRILRMLDAGTSLTVLEQNQEGWSRVRTPQGVEGWILTRYLENTRSARERLAALTTTHERTLQELQQLKENLGSESERLQAAQRELSELGSANEQMKRQLGEAARGVAMANENRELKKQVVDLQRDIELLQNEAERLRDRSQRDWFVAGALVIVGGFIAGILVTRIRWRKKSSWSSL